MKLFRIVGLVLVVSLLVGTVGVAFAADPTVKMAILAPMSGDVGTFGESTKNGAEMAFEEWNAEGGVNGEQVEWVVGDTRCDPLEARNAASKAIDQDGVKYIVGAVCSSSSIPISDVANPKGVLQISPTSTNPQVTLDQDGNVKPYTFRACFIDPFQGTVAAQFALETLGATKAAVLKDVGNDYVKGLAEFFETGFMAGGGAIVASEAYTKDDTDFSAILAKVASVEPDVLYLPDYYNKVSLIAKQAKEKGIDVPMMGGDGWDSPDLDRSAVDGGFYTNHYSPEDPRPEVQDFVAAYEEKYGAVPDALGTLAYDAVNMLLQAMTEAGTNDPEVVKGALEAIEFSGVSGQITLDVNHNPVKSAVILQVKDGEIGYKETVSPILLGEGDETADAPAPEETESN
jgi:branched-chain amino acid transport system substrate-binding protein